MLSLLSSQKSRFSENVILTLISRKQAFRKRYSYSHLKEVDSLKTLFFVSSPESRSSENIILSLASRKQAFRKYYPWDCLLEVANACLFIESLSADRVGEYCIRLTKRYQRWRGMSRFRPLRGRLWGVYDTLLRPGTYGSSKNGSVFVPLGAAGWGVCNTPLQLDTCDPLKY